MNIPLKRIGHFGRNPAIEALLLVRFSGYWSQGPVQESTQDTNYQSSGCQVFRTSSTAQGGGGSIKKGNL